MSWMPIGRDERRRVVGVVLAVGIHQQHDSPVASRMPVLTAAPLPLL